MGGAGQREERASEQERERVRRKGGQSTRITFRVEVICVCGQRQSGNAGEVLEILLKVSGLGKSRKYTFTLGRYLKNSYF